MGNRELQRALKRVKSGTPVQVVFERRHAGKHELQHYAYGHYDNENGRNLFLTFGPDDDVPVGRGHIDLEYVNGVYRVKPTQRLILYRGENRRELKKALKELDTVSSCHIEVQFTRNRGQQETCPHLVFGNYRSQSPYYLFLMFADTRAPVGRGAVPLDDINRVARVTGYRRSKIYNRP